MELILYVECSQELLQVYGIIALFYFSVMKDVLSFFWCVKWDTGSKKLYDVFLDYVNIIQFFSLESEIFLEWFNIVSVFWLVQKLFW